MENCLRGPSTVWSCLNVFLKARHDRQSADSMHGEMYAETSMDKTWCSLDEYGLSEQ